MPHIHIGISGWTYAPWRGTFYPPALPQNGELAFASRAMASIEINGTFDSMQRPSSFATWYEQTPDDFVFSVKCPRFITHMKRLRDVEVPLANFFASGLLRLNEKLGPLLWQFPPNFRFDAELFEAFFEQLPRTTEAAVDLAKRCDPARMKGRSWLKTDADRPIRHAIEIRHETFADAAFVKLLRRHNVAIVVADTAGKWPLLHDVTADFVYARLHGDETLYVSGYSETALDAWAAKVRAWSTGKDAPGQPLLAGPPRKRASRDVYVYFDNDVKVRAPFDAANLAHRLGLRDAPLTPGVELADVKEQARLNWPALPRPRTGVKGKR
jgi:uncharacterized protein YecE (DUF72 family)